jgi:hypothetical protein
MAVLHDLRAVSIDATLRLKKQIVSRAQAERGRRDTSRRCSEERRAERLVDSVRVSRCDHCAAAASVARSTSAM